MITYRDTVDILYYGGDIEHCKVIRNYSEMQECIRICPKISLFL